MTKFKNISVSALLVFAFAVILALPVQATNIYDSYSDFLDDFPAPIVENFEDTTLQPGLSVVSSYFDAKIENGVYKDLISSNTTTTWSHSSGFAAWGGWFDLANPGGREFSSGIDVTVVDTGEFIGTIPSSYDGGFWGFTTGYNFNQVQLSYSAQDVFIRNDSVQEIFVPTQETYFNVDLAYETAPVPEPATMILLGIGLLGIAGISRKKH